MINAPMACLRALKPADETRPGRDGAQARFGRVGECRKGAPQKAPAA